MSDERRETAEVTDDGELLPPTVAVEGAPPQGVREAVVAAVEENPNTLDAPKVYDDEAGPRDRDHAVAYMSARFNELPEVGPGGELRGWLPPYRAREQFTATLREELPEGVAYELENGGLLGFYPE